VRQVLPASEDLSLRSRAALEALDCRSKHAVPPAGWADQARAVIAKQKGYAAGSASMLSSFFSPTSPPGEVLIAVLAPLEDLIDAAKPGPSF
jgi:hypothetical protein